MGGGPSDKSRGRSRTCHSSCLLYNLREEKFGSSACECPRTRPPRCHGSKLSRADRVSEAFCVSESHQAVGSCGLWPEPLKQFSKEGGPSNENRFSDDFLLPACLMSTCTLWSSRQILALQRSCWPRPPRIFRPLRRGAGRWRPLWVWGFREETGRYWLGLPT